MKIERLFQVLVVTGASSTVGLIACGGDDDDGGLPGAGGARMASGGATGSGGTTTGSGGSAPMCDSVCHPSAAESSWTDCNGCCCWLAAGSTAQIGSQICGQEPCCKGRGRP